ncbi:MAG: Gfo/Idh/MocA family oxidoreductase, partial [Verrucomicrobiae bacterium]|nr:Gfo/Idh/MocA family oxidoreductase [Verrucomicrobiae bacterium]
DVYKRQCWSGGFYRGSQVRHDVMDRATTTNVWRDRMKQDWKDRWTRRDFLKRAAGAGATLAFPNLVPSSVLGASAPSNQTTVGCIGVGGRGTGLLNDAANQANVKIVAVCDVFQDRRERRAAELDKRYNGKVCTPYRDLRELLARDDIDAVTIGTPDHWHVPAALMAVRSGKDVYVEKPLGLSMEEDIAIRREVQRYGRIFQYGTQQRSIAHVRFGCELVRNGRLGKIQSVEVTAPSYGYEGGSLEPIPVPEGFDYDLWLGPAQWRPYTKDRCTSWGAYWVLDNAHGFIGGWGAHPLTDMVWALGDDPMSSVPVEFEGTGKFGTGLFDAPYDWDIRGKFAGGASFHFTPGGDCAIITGEKGEVRISRGRLITQPESLKQERFGPGETRLYESRQHMANFIECVRTRRQTVAPVEVAVMSDTITQLSMIAIYTGRKIKWDPVREVILDDPGASQLLTRALRSPWHL